MAGKRKRSTLPTSCGQILEALGDLPKVNGVKVLCLMVISCHVKLFPASIWEPSNSTIKPRIIFFKSTDGETPSKCDGPY